MAFAPPLQHGLLVEQLNKLQADRGTNLYRIKARVLLLDDTRPGGRPEWHKVHFVKRSGYGNFHILVFVLVWGWLAPASWLLVLYHPPPLTTTTTTAAAAIPADVTCIPLWMFFEDHYHTDVRNVLAPCDPRTRRVARSTWCPCSLDAGGWLAIRW